MTGYISYVHISIIFQFQANVCGFDIYVRGIGFIGIMGLHRPWLYEFFFKGAYQMLKKIGINIKDANQN